MSDSDNGSAGSVAHAPKARKGQNGQVAKLRDRFEHPMSQALTVVPASARRSARVASAGQLHKTGKRCRSSAQPSSGEAPLPRQLQIPRHSPLQVYLRIPPQSTLQVCLQTLWQTYWPGLGHWNGTERLLSSSDLTCCKPRLSWQQHVLSS